MMRRLLIAGLVVVATTTGLVLTMPAAPTAQQKPESQQAQPPTPSQPQQPTFRVGATLVRVDALITTKDGEPVADLKPEDFQIFEDNVPQKIRTFEYINIPPGNLTPGERRDPNTVAQSREAAGDPRRRVFVLFLDTYHVTQGAGMWSRAALRKFIDQVIGPDDLIAGMTPDMHPESITFATKTAALETMLESVYGKRDSIHDTPDEEAMRPCFKPDEWTLYRNRRRTKLTLDAVEGLVRHVDGLREERKAIVMVTEGWPLYRNDPELAHDRTSRRAPQGPEIGVGPGGKIGTASMSNPYGLTQGTCDAFRMEIANMETYQQFRDLPDTANRANASFYMVDPRGLVAFDAPIGPEAPPPPNVDRMILRNKLEQMRELADRTQGAAVQNTNDLSGALFRIARDLSAYYLIGYDSTNSKMDGTFRAIKVQLTRPGLVVRARRGYRAPVDGRNTRGPGGAPSTSSASASGNGGGGEGKGAGGTNEVAAAVSALAATRGDLPIRLRVATLRLAGETELRELRIFAELDSKVAANSVWQQGGTARVVVRGLDGSTVATTEAPLGANERTLAMTMPLAANVAPGEYRVQVRVTNASKIDSVGDSVAITVPDRATTIGEASVLRRGPSTGVRYVPTADLRFRRQERVRLELPLVIPIGRVKAIVVDQGGQPMSLPVQVTERTDGAARLAVVDVSLAPLAAGGYAIMVTDTENASGSKVLVPLQLIP